MYWFIFISNSIILKKCENGIYQIPKSEKPPFDIKEWTHVQILPQINNTECRAYSIDFPPTNLHEYKTVNLRDAYNLLPEVFYQMASKASELIYWDSNTKYCGVCGTPLNWQTDISKQCPNCGKEIWPQVSPAIIVRIEKKECYEESKILLVKAKNFTRNFYGLVAGFLETGETLEQCVEREILEETQLKVCNIKYFGSQYWPYPSSIMIGFTADYASGELSLQLDELNAGGWFTINTLPDIPDKMSIARQLIDDWIKKQNNNKQR